MNTRATHSVSAKWSPQYPLLMWRDVSTKRKPHKKNPPVLGVLLPQEQAKRAPPCHIPMISPGNRSFLEAVLRTIPFAPRFWFTSRLRNLLRRSAPPLGCRKRHHGPQEIRMVLLEMPRGLDRL